MTYQYIAGTAATLGALALCALLPAGLSAARDARQMDAIHTVATEPVAVGEDNAYTLPQRIRLLRRESVAEDTQTMVFHTGVHYTHKTARRNAKEQIGVLWQAGLLPEPGEAYHKLVVSSVEFIADSADPSCSLMLWELHARSERSFLTLQMDDETGKVLTCQVTDADGGAWLGALELERAAQAWAGYLGLSLGPPVRMQEESFAPPARALPEQETPAVRALQAAVGDTETQVTYQLYADAQDFRVFVP